MPLSDGNQGGNVGAPSGPRPGREEARTRQGVGAIGGKGMRPRHASQAPRVTLFHPQHEVRDARTTVDPRRPSRHGRLMSRLAPPGPIVGPPRVARTDPRQHLVAFERRQREPWRVMWDHAAARMRLYPGTTYHDKGGVGNPADDMIGGYDVRGVYLQGEERRQIWREYTTAIEGGEVKVPRIDWATTRTATA